jgi:hypothetical protein
VNSGILTVNEGREFFDLNPIDGGDTPLIQGAMKPLEDIINPPPPPPMPPQEDDDTEQDGDDNPQDDTPPENLLTVFRALLSDAYAHLIRIEADKAKRAYNKGTLPEHARDFYGPHADHTAKALQPTFAAFLMASGRKADPGPLAREAALRHVEASRKSLSRGIEDVEHWGQRPALAADTDMGILWKAT